VVAGYEKGECPEILWASRCFEDEMSLGVKSSRDSNPKAMKIQTFFDSGIRSPQVKSIGSTRIRISVMTSKAVATCHPRYYDLCSAEIGMKMR